jgi:hypothetical protein
MIPFVYSKFGLDPRNLRMKTIKLSLFRIITNGFDPIRHFTLLYLIVSNWCEYTTGPHLEVHGKVRGLRGLRRRSE